MEQGREREVEGRRARSVLAVAFNNAWDKLTKYYKLTDDSHAVYAAAVLLHPMYRKRYFDDNWDTDDLIAWKPQTIQNIKSIWEKEYKGNDTIELGPVIGSKHKEREPDILDRYLRTPRTEIPCDCFDSYINGSITELGEDANAVAWWNNPANPWKDLRKLAFDLLSIPAVSAEVERVFSSAKRLITPDRNRLNDETIEYLELLRYWWRNNIITQRR